MNFDFANNSLPPTRSSGGIVKQRPMLRPISPRIRKQRLLIVGTVSLVWFLIVGIRLFSIQVSDVEKWREWSIKQHFTDITTATARAQILDRRNRPLARSVPVKSIYIRPAQIIDKNLTIATLSENLNINKTTLRSYVDSKKPFVWIQRQVPMVLAERVMSHKLVGVSTVDESKRYYPYNEAGSVVLGRVGLDGTGLSGLERYYDKKLRGWERTTTAKRDALGNNIANVDYDNTFSENTEDRSSIRLTLDAEISAIVAEELERGRIEAKAKRAMAIMIASETGEVLAMAQAPTINLNNGRVSARDQLANWSVESVYEPGSVIKPLIGAVALEENVVSPNQLINCEKGRYRFGGHLINDSHPQDIISFHDVIVRSSNIGMTKIAEKMGAEKVSSILKSFGFGIDSGLPLQGDSEGILRPVESWSEVDIATHSFGQGMAVTPLQIVRAYGALANGGTLIPLSLVKNKKFTGKKVLDTSATLMMTKMLQGVVEDEKGTAKNAAIPGYIVVGKTGTAQKAKVSGRGYESGAYLSSFIGYTRLYSGGLAVTPVLYVILDEPQGDSYYGGIVAAPIFKKIMTRTIRYFSTLNRSSQSWQTLPQPVPVKIDNNIIDSPLLF
jgi:cell division protein FtsI (penicillin-binding protein 3)